MDNEKKIISFLPVYHRSPNKFLRYEIEDFNDGKGNSGKYRIAHFLDKKGKPDKMIAQVLWEFMWCKPYKR